MTYIGKYLVIISKLHIFDEEIEELINFLKDASTIDLLPLLIKNKLINMFLYQIQKLELFNLVDKQTYRSLVSITSHSSIMNHEYEKEFGKIGGELHKEGIEYAIIKGFHLSNYIYGYPYGYQLRMYNDIDILIKKVDLEKTNRILRSNNYIQGDISLNDFELYQCNREEKINYLLNSHQQYQHIKKSNISEIAPGNIDIIDVNFSIFEGGNIQDPIRTSLLLEDRIKRNTKSGVDYYSLSVEKDIIQLCYHLYKDTVYEVKAYNNESLKIAALSDIYHLIKQEFIKWDILFDTVSTAQIENQIYYVLSLLDMLFSDLDLKHILTLLKPSVDEEIEERIATDYIRVICQ